ncbi:hypothetical protein [Citrobacter farmeri]|uniref:hypothetical protein n=1 Tax=Citrobacter farmeri TaxID=67824 RepID=UPI0018AA18F1|nr:hypothetical protein [Citrobacter farmeri]MDB2181129.1 hypothetical protein [Citrobacter farmeri]
MSEFNIEDLDAVIAEAGSSLVQMLALQLRSELENSANLREQLSEAQREFRSADITMQNLEAKCEKLAAENAGLKDFVKTCFRAAADGASLDGADIQELGERLGLFGRETYQPALHGYICGHEAGEDTVYVMKKTPATDAFLAEVRAHARTDFIDRIEWIVRNECNPEKTETIINELKAFAAQLRKGVQS